MVVISPPSTITASARQLLIGRPSRSTVQTPHTPMLHVSLVPVRPRSSRSRSTSSRFGGTLSSWACPLTVSLTVWVSVMAQRSAGWHPSPPAPLSRTRERGGRRDTTPLSCRTGGGGRSAPPPYPPRLVHDPPECDAAHDLRRQRQVERVRPDRVHDGAHDSRRQAGVRALA